MKVEIREVPGKVFPEPDIEIVIPIGLIRGRFWSTMGKDSRNYQVGAFVRQFLEDQIHTLLGNIELPSNVTSDRD